MLASVHSRHLAAFDGGITQVAKDILWIGCNDWDVREFHSLSIPGGTSYNSYVIQASEPTLIDGVEAPFVGQWVSRLQSLYGEDLRGLKNIIVQHAEPDHTSGIPCLLQRFPHIKILCTKVCFNNLSRFYNTKNWNWQEVKLGKPISLGNKTVVMAGLPMAHWPESCATYIPEQKILFTNDAFGQHIASTKRFVDEIDQSFYLREAKSYYGNILARLTKPVLNAIKTAGSLPGIDYVFPSHGVAYRRPEDIARAIKLYTDWANQKPSSKVTVIYDCNWFGTEKMAEALASGASKVSGVDVGMYHCRKTHITKVATEMLDTAALAVGSSTLHECILPDLALHLSYLKCLQPKNKVAAIFGTYGWNKSAVPKDIRGHLFTPAKIPELCEPVMAHWNPDDSDLKRCEELGKKLAEAAKEKAAAAE